MRKETTALHVGPCHASMARLCDFGLIICTSPAPTSTLVSNPGCACLVAVVWSHRRFGSILVKSNQVKFDSVTLVHFTLFHFGHDHVCPRPLCYCVGVASMPPCHYTTGTNQVCRACHPQTCVKQTVEKRFATSDVLLILCSRNQHWLTACIYSLLARTREPLHHNLIRPPMPLCVRNQRQATCFCTRNLQKSSVCYRCMQKWKQREYQVDAAQEKA